MIPWADDQPGPTRHWPGRPGSLQHAMSDGERWQARTMHESCLSLLNSDFTGGGMSQHQVLTSNLKR